MIPKLKDFRFEKLVNFLTLLYYVYSYMLSTLLYLRHIEMWTFGHRKENCWKRHCLFFDGSVVVVGPWVQEIC